MPSTTTAQSSSTTSLAHDTIVPSLPLSRKQSCVPAAGLDDDVAEARRVCTERELDEEVRAVLSKMIERVEELADLLAQSQFSQAELETSLVLTRSNLTLALSNTEMLEEALKRMGDGSGSAGRDIGWRRWSDREGKGLLKRSVTIAERAGTPEKVGDGVNNNDGRRGSIHSLPPRPATPPINAGASAGSATVPVERVRTNSTTAPPPAKATPESRFFKFRFGGARTTSSSTNNSVSATTSPRATSPTRSLTPAPGAQFQQSQSDPSTPVTATPLPAAAPISPVPVQTNKREEELDELLAKEREAHKKLQSEKAALEDELESLSAALFEEANKMVASERRKRAEAEEELQNVLSEREALRGALRVVEGENTRLRQVEAEEAPAEQARPDLSSTSTSASEAPSVDPENVWAKPTPASTPPWLSASTTRALEAGASTAALAEAPSLISSSTLVTDPTGAGVDGDGIQEADSHPFYTRLGPSSPPAGSAPWLDALDSPDDNLSDADTESVDATAAANGNDKARKELADVMKRLEELADDLDLGDSSE
ncbi:hypothetical protein BOTBODRAFT_34515 [Botryobasidium botryosum FD-172 SS1]|uniref:GDP/GTP exchange factor Sec2 N-terminal domain-containing protein n=1 Tax=Botryobasidium botryosum (strain FD-172 SS1) TaxID=930990 RepID=A0A067MC20_BOTB1|nr:hypothetical protein BOTBODRAFT_34515 [Botryobasidium botryosum FD-172 SS1]